MTLASKSPLKRLIALAICRNPYNFTDQSHPTFHSDCDSSCSFSSSPAFFPTPSKSQLSQPRHDKHIPADFFLLLVDPLFKIALFVRVKTRLSRPLSGSG
jgi:hypothetical protein